MNIHFFILWIGIFLGMTPKGMGQNISTASVPDTPYPTPWISLAYNASTLQTSPRFYKELGHLLDLQTPSVMHNVALLLCTAGMDPFSLHLRADFSISPKV